ncbi:pyruvate ferredoxin oxidoreductase [Candidatus Bathyarchaeota archaeon]|nr:pyruvate ferredoxin oxidoreductase [Candidatus Bathyarchaeota archaeon]
MPITVVRKEYYQTKTPPFAPSMIPYKGEGMTVEPTQETAGYTGDEAIALAAKQSKVAVVSAYPITPQTIIMERFSEYVANGEVDTEFICVESEHSALSACIGSSLCGVRVFTASSSQGLALMHEVLYTTSGLRCPVVMAVANRALSAPINIHGDHSDMMGSRDCGWVQIFVENVQEAYDWTIMAFKIAEDKDVQLPVSVNLDGFTLTHSMEDLYVLKDEDVVKFVGTRKADLKLDPMNPITFGGLALPEYYFEMKRQQDQALQNAHPVTEKVLEEYCSVSGRRYGLVETYAIEDAEAAILCLGSASGTAREAVNQLRAQGKKVGAIKLWLYRPLPTDELLEVTKGLKSIVVLDRSISFGAPFNPVCSDIASTLHWAGRNTKVLNAVLGIGGRDISVKDLAGELEKALEVAETGITKAPITYVGVRE